MRQAFLDLALEKGAKETYFRGGYQSWAEWRSPSDVCGLKAFMTALDRVHSDEVILSRRPYDHSVEVLTELAEECDLMYVTQRDLKRWGATNEWLTKCGFPRARLAHEVDLRLTGNDKSKDLADCQYLIDDRPKTLVEFVYDSSWAVLRNEQRRKGFGLMYEYNRALTDVPNVYLAPTWLGLRFYLIEKGVMSGRSIPHPTLATG